MTFAVDPAGVAVRVRVVVLPPLGEVPAPEARVREYLEVCEERGYDHIHAWGIRGKFTDLTATDLRDVLAELHAYRAVVEAIGLLPAPPPCGVGIDDRCNANACGFPCEVRR